METQLKEKTVSPGSTMKVAELLLHLGNTVPTGEWREGREMHLASSIKNKNVN